MHYLFTCKFPSSNWIVSIINILSISSQYRNKVYGCCHVLISRLLARYKLSVFSGGTLKSYNTLHKSMLSIFLEAGISILWLAILLAQSVNAFARFIPILKPVRNPSIFTSNAYKFFTIIRAFFIIILSFQFLYPYTIFLIP